MRKLIHEQYQNDIAFCTPQIHRPTMPDLKDLNEQTDLTLDPRSSTSGDSSCSESQFVTTKKKKIHNRSRWNRLTALSIGVLTLAIVGVAVFLVLRWLGIRLRRPSSSEILLEPMTAAAIALHDSPEDCWMAIHGVVYDLTTYAPRHPTGPDYIWDRCGMDGTVDYDKFHKSTRLLRVVAKKQVGLFGTTSSAFQTPGETSDSGDSGGECHRDDRMGTILTEMFHSLAQLRQTKPPNL